MSSDATDSQETPGLPRIHALGFSQTEFHPARPGRLCRGRERWIEPWEMDEDSCEPISRLVISGAEFTDDSARDAMRGLPYSRVDTLDLIDRLFTGKTFLAFMEDGHPADIPANAEGVELYEGYRAGGLSELGLVRWYQRVRGPEELRALFGDNPGSYTERVRGLAVVDKNTEDEVLFDLLYRLVGMSCLDSPPAHYQPSALPDVLEMTPAVVVLHRDKHALSLGVYSREALDVEPTLDALCAGEGALLIRFAIPPMLARWDRALSEARAAWVNERDDEFPVPPAPEPSDWGHRRRRGRKAKSAPDPLDSLLREE